MSSMQLEIGVPSLTDPDTAAKAMVHMSMSHRGRHIDSTENFEHLHVTVERAMDESRVVADMNICKVPMDSPRSLSEEDDYAAGDDESHSQPGVRHSAYPVGAITSTQMHRVPGAHSLIWRIKNLEESHTRETAGKVVLGAYCAMVRDYAFGKSTHRTYFMEDIECDEMHAYASHVASIISESCAEISVSRVRWGCTDVMMYSVPLQGASDDSVFDSMADAQPPLYVFAFCKARETRPFAISGCRFMIRKFSPETWAAIMWSCDSVQHHQYPVPLEQMVHEIQKQVGPQTSTLVPMQRFALQQCFVSHACTLHTAEFGPHKRILRRLVTEWYKRRVVAIPQPQDEGAAGGRVEIWDLSSMLNSEDRLRRDISPQWWYCAAMG
eukprot:CAMPEP_0173407328 /NCGR_PEP_ID=MMETSP1356-20130122/66840_1 /TAXON_ID=77927 ORGANISM="Hemiselmis virescens, Strain PCC157" /NCGR_SAMPLE_ID=MMETSP1356 /ASSEMBLY_ACC=CAM_ASM_000847 /LENGTH=381 /DNA_ID=CAMNT_0014368487 /DNA_START=102 /DNA_END=1247 /DNA_ORIENTATION=-